MGAGSAAVSSSARGHSSHSEWTYRNRADIYTPPLLQLRTTEGRLYRAIYHLVRHPLFYLPSSHMSFISFHSSPCFPIFLLLQRSPPPPSSPSSALRLPPEALPDWMASGLGPLSPPRPPAAAAAGPTFAAGAAGSAGTAERSAAPLALCFAPASSGALKNKTLQTSPRPFLVLCTSSDTRGLLVRKWPPPRSPGVTAGGDCEPLLGRRCEVPNTATLLLPLPRRPASALLSPLRLPFIFSLFAPCPLCGRSQMRNFTLRGFLYFSPPCSR